LVTKEAPVLNRRLEMPAIRADGTEFPVELTISRISGEGPPAFTGFVRDITERRRSETERADLLAREQRARASADVAESRAAFLLHAGGAPRPPRGAPRAAPRGGALGRSEDRRWGGGGHPGGKGSLGGARDEPRRPRPCARRGAGRPVSRRPRRAARARACLR